MAGASDGAAGRLCVLAEGRTLAERVSGVQTALLMSQAPALVELLLTWLDAWHDEREFSSRLGEVYDVAERLADQLVEMGVLEVE